MDEMDIDMDIDLHVEPEVESHSVNPFLEPTPQLQESAAFGSATWGAVQPTEIVDGEVQQEKIHVRGLDSLSTDDVKKIALEHYPDSFVRVEWIDDTSANLVYETPEAGAQALYALSAQAPDQLPALETRTSKKISSHPLTDFYIRQATTADVKQKKAHEASRYYLLHPEQDPRERNGGQTRGNKRGPRQRRAGSDDEDDYSRRRFDDRELRRRKEAQDFDASMYDDDEGTAALGSDADDLFSSNNRNQGRSRQRRDDSDLFGDKARGNGRLRDRSASPGRADGDGRHGFGEDTAAAARRVNRARSRTPPRRGNKSSNNEGKELFSQPMISMLNASKTSPAQTKELFSVKTATTPSKELFSHRSSMGRHRRSGAVDASPRSSTFDLLSSPNDGNGLNGFPETTQRTGSLADRISGGSSLSIKGAGSGRDEGGLNIRGGAGFSVRGAAAPPPTMTARELFPMKAGTNVGKELFGEKLQGRDRSRRKAEDMFY